VPIGDYFLFHPYTYLLNLGGIANITIKQGQSMLAFDIGVANQALNYYAQKRGLAYDDKGSMAAKGRLHTALAAKLAEHPYYKIQGPKSLSNAQAMELITPLMEEENLSVEDALHTIVHILVERIAEALQAHPIPENAALLVTGGGAFNDYLVQQLRARLQAYGIETVVPDALVVQYKEALIMAFIGVLRWREELNVLKSVTGAQRSSIGGAFWMGA
jgi:anhydro-N-acetylmuramic acid kinase